MFVCGYAYAGEEGKSGFRPETPVQTAAQAQKLIKEKLAGKKVDFAESGGKFRAYADGKPTGYMYFPVKAETWIAIDETSLGEKGSRAVFAKGSLNDVKAKVRNHVQKSHNSLANMTFTRAGDNISVYMEADGLPYPRPAEILLVRVS